MISFKRFIIEGGNLTLVKDGVEVSADRLDLSKTTREKLKELIANVAIAVDKAHKKIHGHDLWVNAADAFKKPLLVSGSARLALEDDIPWDELVKAKGSLGDIDLQYPEAERDALKKTLTDLEGKSVGGAKLIGMGGASPTQWNCVFELPGGMKVQIDFEPVEMKDNVPTEFSKYKFHSDWSDVKAGVKGAFTKYLVQSVIQIRSRLKDIVVVGANGKPLKADKWKNPGSLAMSERGLRSKFEKVMDGDKQQEIDGKPVYRALETSESKYTKDMGALSAAVFGEGGEKKSELLLSFTKMLDELAKTLTGEQKKELRPVLLNFIWGPAAPKFYKGNADKDRADKEAAMKAFTEKIGIKATPEEEKMKQAYYENY